MLRVGRGTDRLVLTIFTAPKAFDGHIGDIQRNAVRSWLSLGSDIQVLLVGDEAGMGANAERLGVEHVSAVERNANGTPLVSSIFARARERARHAVLCYANADIIFLDDLLTSVRRVIDRFTSYLIVGQRWDLRVDRELEFDAVGSDLLRARLTVDGRRHPPAGSDYFIFPRIEFTHLPAFALGRAGWDNWMIYAGRAAHAAVIDASRAITVIHQDHDYAHLPGGKPHYRLPESSENVRLAGGRETIFTLRDANWELDGSDLRRRRWDSAGWSRGFETMLTVRFGPGNVARLVRMGLHPGETIAYYWHALARRLAQGHRRDPRGRTRWDA